MNEIYIAIKDILESPLGNGLLVKKYIDLGFDIYSESLEDHHRETVYLQTEGKFLREVYIWIDDVRHTVADPEHGWIGL